MSTDPAHQPKLTDREIFDLEMARFGGRIPTESLPEDSQSGFADITAQVTSLLDSVKLSLPESPSIHFGFVLNASVNAWAFKSHGQHFIAITTGSVYILTLVFFRILADSTLLPDIGDPKLERDDLLPLKNFLLDADKLLSLGHIPVQPVTDERTNYALFLRDLALMFLVGHEIAHIVRGHVDYLQNDNAFSMIQELGWAGATTDAFLERQCLEKDADTRSAWSRVDSLKLTYQTQGETPPPGAAVPKRRGSLYFTGLSR